MTARRRSRLDADAAVERLAGREGPTWLPGSRRAPSGDTPERSCLGKDRYPTVTAARAVAAMNGMSAVLQAYLCTFCDAWHLTRARRKRDS